MVVMDEKKTLQPSPGKEEDRIAISDDNNRINASGHADQLHRQYGLVGLAGTAITVNNAWVVLGSSISISLRRFLQLQTRGRHLTETQSTVVLRA